MNFTPVATDDTVRRDPVDIDLALLEERFNPMLIRRISTLLVFMACLMLGVITFGGLSGSTSGAVLGIVVGWMAAVVIFWEAGVFWGSMYTVVIAKGEVIRVNRYPVMTGESEADVCVIVYTPGLFAPRRIQIASAMPNFPYTTVFSRDPENLVMRTTSANVGVGELRALINLVRVATVPRAE